MADKIDPNDPSSVSDAYKMMAPRIAKMRAVLGGTETMREAGTEFLPQHPAEENSSYHERLVRSVLYNVTDLTLTSWVGSVFKQDLQIDPALDAQIGALLPDIDLMGNSVQVFARRWFKSGLSFAAAPLLVLYPMTDPSVPAPQTLQDDQLEAKRPFWQALAPENVIFARSERGVDGRDRITHLRVRGERIQHDNFVDIVIPQITVYTSEDVTIYEIVSTRAGKKIWAPIGPSVPHGMGEVPLVVFYTEPEDLMVGTSALMHLADLNIQHWQSSSDQINCLTVARFPILAGTGVSNDDKIIVGPRQYLHSDNEQAKFAYVEHNGAALSAGENDLKSIEARMSNYGAEFLKRRPGRETATARALDSSEATSQIEDVAGRFNDALDQALYFTAKWMSLPAPAPGMLKVSTRIEDPTMDPTIEGDTAATPVP